MADWGQIDKVRERHKMNVKGEMVKVFHVEATTTRGMPFTMDITDEELDPEKADEIMGTRAREIDYLLEL